MKPRRSLTKGFKRTGSVLSAQICRTSETRGFAVSKVLTHWIEIAGEDIAAIARPVEITYGHKGLGATLTVLTTGAQAPMLEMQKEGLRARVNAVYGYNAISRLRITQTAATGFAEGQADFSYASRKTQKPAPSAETCRAAQDAARPIANDDLRLALEQLGRNVLTKTKQ